MFEYHYTCNCCKATEGVEMREVGKEARLPLCSECADVHNNLGDKVGRIAKQQQAEDRLIGVVKGDSPQPN
jgi:hypothetical protein